MGDKSSRETRQILFAEQARNKIRSSNPRMRQSGLFDAVNYDLKELSGEILTLFQKETDNWIKSRCAWALGRLHYLAAYNDLAQGLRDKDKSVRIWSAWALGEIGLDKATKPLIEALEIERIATVRRAIGGALKKIRLEPVRVHRKQILKQLQPPLTEDSVIMTIVRKLEALGSIEDKDAIIALREQILHRDRLYFERYMEWVKKKRILENVLVDKRKVFSDDEIE